VDNKFYSPDHDRAEKVHELFVTIARRYDLLNDIMSAGQHRKWKRCLVRLAGNPHDVLDLCCGTGDLAQAFGVDCRVIGVDFTREMLHIAAERCRRPVNWMQADALQLPFADNAFDVVSVGFGLRNLADLDAGLREIRRVLRPGGKVLSLDFGKPEWALWRRLCFAHLQFWVPALGWLLAGNRDAYAYILPSLENYPGQRGIRVLMEAVGFCDCGCTEFVGGAIAINFGDKPR
jgi:demethylmenaquinone methyltransferase/2-methoxy-6-polyprenyl-1,4-benzoquinol methylase